MKSKQIEELNLMEDWPNDVIHFVRIVSLIRGICAELNENIPLLKILSRRAQQFLYMESINLELNKQQLLRIKSINKFERRLSDYIEKVMDENNVLGLQIAVIKNGKNLASISKGIKGELNGNNVDENTLFNGFFVNLGILVIAILICVEKGYISLDDPICHYWDGFIRYGKRNITLRHVLDHRSGVISFFPEDMGLKEFLSYEKIIRIIEDSAPQIPINQITRYNPYFLGWVLSELITLLTNQPTTKFIEDNIINPLGLSDGIKIHVPEYSLSKDQASICQSERCDEKIIGTNHNSNNSKFPFPLFSSRFSSSSSFFAQEESTSSTLRLSNIKSKLESSNGTQFMNEIKEIIIQKLTPERARKKEEGINDNINDDHDDENIKMIDISDRFAMVNRRMEFSSISFKQILEKLKSSESFRLINYDQQGNNRTKTNFKLSTLEYFFLKPHILDPLIYNSKKLINKWIPPTNGRYTSLSLAKLYGHLSRGEIIGEKLLKQVIKDESITYDNSIEGLILTYGGPRKWSLGFQILECNEIYYNNQNNQKDGQSCFKGIGHSDIGGNLSFCFPEIDLSIVILTNDYVKGSHISQLILSYILENFGLYLNNYVPLFFF